MSFSRAELDDALAELRDLALEAKDIRLLTANRKVQYAASDMAAWAESLSKREALIANMERDATRRLEEAEQIKYDIERVKAAEGPAQEALKKIVEIAEEWTWRDG